METIKIIATHVAFWAFVVLCFIYAVRLALAIPKIKKLRENPATRDLVSKYSIAMQLSEVIAILIGITISICSFFN